MKERSRTMEMELHGDTRQVPSYARMLQNQPVPALTILHHPRLKRVGERVVLPELLEADEQLEVSRLTPEFMSPTGHEGTPLATHFVSRKAVLLIGRPEGGVTLDASAHADGSVRVDGVSLTRALDFTRDKLKEGVVIELGGQVVLLLHVRDVPPEQPSSDKLGLVGESDAMQVVREAVLRAARQAGPVLVRGETGTGKELVAGALHQASARKEGPYVAVNMAAIPPTLAASELFGHAKGAFSGAVQQNLGMFGRAHGGTLFMDEIGDTPLDVQAALLRVLETGEVQQVGADKTRQVDVRVIAATDADLEGMVAAGRFRAPLRYRLSNHEVRLPPLRSRKDDVGRLLVHFLKVELAAAGREGEIEAVTGEGTSWVPAALTARLARYHWPGNVRQLRNVARWLATLDHRARPVDAADPALASLLPGEMVEKGSATTTTQPVPPTATAPELPAVTAAAAAASPAKRKSQLSMISPDELERLMEQNEYKLGVVADALGVSRPALNDLVDAHPRLKRAQNLTVQEILEARAQCGDIDAMWRYLKVSEKSLKLRMSALGLLS